MKRDLFLVLLAAVAGLPLAETYAQQEKADASIEVLSTWTSEHTFVTAQGISNDRKIAGTFNEGAQNPENGYISNLRGRLTAMFTVSPTARTLVQEINSSGLVTGFFIDADEIHGFFYQDGVVTPYDVPGANLTIIYGLNDAGDFTGDYSRDGGASSTPFASLGGTITDLGVPGSDFSWFWAINNRTEIVGY